MPRCFCGEFDTPTIAPDEFGETCFHDPHKCEVRPVRIPDETVIRVLRARAEAAEAERDALRAAVERVRALHVASKIVKSRISGHPVCCRCHDISPCDTLRALDGGDE